MRYQDVLINITINMLIIITFTDYYSILIITDHKLNSSVFAN